MRIVLFSILIVSLGLCSEVYAQDRLYPVSRTVPALSLSARYYAKVDSLLLNNGAFSDFAFEIRPSFAAESGCYYDKRDSSLVLRISDRNIWYAILTKNGKKQELPDDVRISEYHCSIPSATTKQLRHLFFAAVFSSSYSAEPLGTDGTVYELSVFGGRFSAACRSPHDNSNCFKLTEILSSLVTAIKTNNPATIEDLTPTIEALAQQFEALIPDYNKENNVWPDC